MISQQLNFFKIFISGSKTNRLISFISCFVLIFLFSFSSEIYSQPSGGPYGPIPQKYELPKVTGKIYFVSPDGKTDQSGESVSNPTTIESAIAKVKTGDAIILRGGIYRTGNLLLNQGITIQPYEDEQPVKRNIRCR